MDNLGLKFSLYDFFGYVFPGAILLVLIYLGIGQAIAIEFHIYTIMEISKELRVYIFITLIGISYIVGHMISSASSAVFEKLMIDKIKKIKEQLLLQNILSNNLYNLFQKKFSEVFQVDFQNKDFPICITYIISNEPSIYNRAFVFLIFYGMSRSISFIFSLFSIFQIILLFCHTGSVVYTVISLLITIVFFYEYIRFFKYFLREISVGFITCKIKSNNFKMLEN